MLLIMRNMEIRHMRTAQLEKLGGLLDRNRMWVDLMELIPKNLQDIEAIDTTKSNAKIVKKYKREDIRTIETASKEQRRSASVILFEEWGTSGRVRPTIGHLLQLLVRVQLFRAAEYVAVDILSEAPPPRPAKGPAALIDTTIPADVLQREIESQLGHLHYPHTESLIAKHSTMADNPNINCRNKLNIERCKVNFLSSPQQTTSTQSNNVANSLEERLEQITNNFERLTTNHSIANGSRTLATSHSGNERTTDGLTTSIGAQTANTQSTNVSANTSLLLSNGTSSQFIPLMVRDVEQQLANASLDETTSESQVQATTSNYSNAFIPLAVLNGDINETIHSASNNSNMYSTSTTTELSETFDDISSGSSMSTVSTAMDSSSILIPLSVKDETINHSPGHNATNR